MLLCWEQGEVRLVMPSSNNSGNTARAGVDKSRPTALTARPR